ncbi:hypothetical protein SAMN05421852_10949 [Thermoflavimicrobium dichotomicum]|uniref:Tfp pilus assembly protein, ATPase PilM n=1 Tax=Thermoflavimicrobium dichotomicum TaxID=46223 RepID=A0A1I3R9K7_9BACL|nr:hypothetical protein SAMN05421852_10949 [Thermoflavimicrobium dichotomicum]
MFQRRFLGIEIQDHYFKMIELHKRKTSPVVQHVITHSIPWETSGADHLLDREKFIWLLNRLKEEQHISARTVHLVMDSQFISVYKQPVPIRIKDHELRSWLKRNVVSKLTEKEVIFDFFPMRSDSLAERKVMLFMVSKEFIVSIEEILAWSGLELVAVHFSSLSLNDWLQFVRNDLPFHFCTFRFSTNGLELCWFRNGQLEGMKYLTFPLVSFCNRVIYPQSDLLEPILTEPSEIARFGEAMLARVDQEMERWFQEYHWLPDEWILTGEGVDLELLREWLYGHIPAKISVDQLPDYMLSRKLRKVSSKRLGASLSILIGSLLSGRK